MRKLRWWHIAVFGTVREQSGQFRLGEGLHSWIATDQRQQPAQPDI